VDQARARAAAYHLVMIQVIPPFATLIVAQARRQVELSHGFA
jgi:hypothetical protein